MGFWNSQCKVRICNQLFEYRSETGENGGLPKDRVQTRKIIGGWFKTELDVRSKVSDF